LWIDSPELVQDTDIEYKLRDSDCRAFLAHDFVESGGALDAPNLLEHAIPFLNELGAFHNDVSYSLRPKLAGAIR
jgi:hypothetical protein